MSCFYCYIYSTPVGTLTFYTNVVVRCSLFNNSTLNSSEEACWCESVHCPLKEQRIEGVRENGVGPSARSDLDVLDLGCGMHSFPLHLLLCQSPRESQVMDHGVKLVRCGSAPRPRRNKMPSDMVVCSESCVWSGVEPSLLEAGHPV